MGGGSSKSVAATHVVVVGGNLGGSAVAGALEKKGFKVTVIEPKDRLFVNFGVPRAAVEAGFEDKLLIPTDRVFKREGNTFARGWATGVDTAARTVTYQPVAGPQGEASGAPVALKYDYLVLCCGGDYQGPLKGHAGLAATKAGIAALREAVRTSARVAVVGGGATGVEMAGEIKAAAKDSKTVTLVHSRAELLSDPGAGLTPKFRARMAAEARLVGIELALGQRVAGLDALGAAEGTVTVAPGVYRSSSSAEGWEGKGGITLRTPEGKEIVTADLVIVAAGQKPATAWLRGGPLAAALDASGSLKVEATFQLSQQHGGGRVFAMGDCTASHDMRAGWVLDGQAAVVSENVARLAGAGADPETARVTLKQGKAQKGLSLVPVGPARGAGQVPGLGVVGSWAAKFKAKDYFSGMMAGNVGYKTEEVVAANKRAA